MSLASTGLAGFGAAPVVEDLAHHLAAA